MRLPRTPDLASRRAIALTALVVAVVVGVALSLRDLRGMGITLGDTDDATRLVLARGLLTGTGWFDQHLMRYQPPVGVWMHWSRLLDGGIAAMLGLFRLALPPERAEFATRWLWPLLWIAPAAAAAMAIARRLGARGAVLACALILMTDLSLYAQFHPGRIDHHDVQITLSLIALAGAVQLETSIAGPLIAGVATGLGLAIGLEALVFDVAIGAGMALAFLGEAPVKRARLQAYGGGLALSTALAFVAQTPPERWGVAACDALAVNLLAGVVVAGTGLVAVARLTAARSWQVRLAGLGAVGLAAAGVYLALDPHCRAGPFADVDPAIKPIWLDHVQEVRHWPRLLKVKPGEAIEMAAPCVLGVLAWAWLGLAREIRGTLAWRLVGACFALAIVAAFEAVRMGAYLMWFAVPIVAAAAGEVARRYWRGVVFATVLFGLAASPVVAATLGKQARDWLLNAHKGRPRHADFCFNMDAYQDLADEPAGLVLSEPDLGPFVLAHTPSSALSAPYHRMSWGILKARSVLAAPADAPGPQGAAARARALNVDYVLECRAHRINSDRDGLAADTLQKRLDAGRPPAWLDALSDADEPIQVYAVLPAPAPSPAPDAQR